MAAEDRPYHSWVSRLHGSISGLIHIFNGTACFEKCKELLEYLNFLLCCDIW